MFWRKRKNLAQQRANKRRKGLVAVIIPWFRRFGFGLVVLTGLSWCGAWFFMSDADTHVSDWVHEKTLDKTAALGFTVKDIFVEGRVHTDADVLKAIINTQKGDPLLAFDPAQAQKLIEDITWVDSAHVQRRFPNAIYIELHERQPLALWQDKTKLRLLDQNGEIIAAQTLKPFKDLLIVLGEDAPTEAYNLIRNLQAEPVLINNAQSATRVSARRWDLKLKNGMMIKLPEEDLGLALRKLALAQEQDKMLDKDLKSIDLRDHSRMVVQTKPGASQAYESKKNKASIKPASGGAGNNI